MNIQKKKRYLGECLAIVVLIGGCLLLCNKLFCRQDAKNHYEQFFENAEDIDVIIVGSSHVVEGFYPLQMWNDYGITSYNFGNAALGPIYTYWIFRLGLQYVSPKVAIMDAYGAGKDNDKIDAIGAVHKGLDCFPLNQEKINAVLSMTSDKMQRAELLFPFISYHSRWEEDLIKEYFSRNSIDTKQMGAYYSVGLSDSILQEKISETEILNLENKTKATKAIYDFIALCRERNIEPVLTFLPLEATPDRQMEYNTAKYIAELEEIPFIDMMYTDVFNVITDGSDRNEHLNTSGAMKVTNYIGSYLRENMGLEDHRDDLEYDKWNNYYAQWRQEVILPQVMNQSDFHLILSQLNDKSYGVYIKKFNDVEFSDLERELIQQIPNLLGLEEGDALDNERHCDIRLYLYDMSTGEELSIKEFRKTNYISTYSIAD